MRTKVPGLLSVLLLAGSNPATLSSPLKIHGIFRSNMVLQRGKPIKIWGWTTSGARVQVTLGELSAQATGKGDKGRWEVTFAPQPAKVRGQAITVSSEGKKIELTNILIGDVWVMNGQSNMAVGLGGQYHGDVEKIMGHLPLLRQIRINPNESEHLITDLEDRAINGKRESKDWNIATPATVSDMGAIGYFFASRIQRALQIPIGIIDNSRGGAGIESLVPRHKFAEHPQAKRYLAFVDARNTAFDEDAYFQAQMDRYTKRVKQLEKQVENDKKKGRTRKVRWPAKPVSGKIRSWNVPGRSPSDAASCYNGMFGVFKGLNIKGVAFHQGYNNALGNDVCKPKFYRVLMKLMMEGWREDFSDPRLPIAVIGFCASGGAQEPSNFEKVSTSPGAYIREAQRLAVEDMNDASVVYIPSYDQSYPNAHPKKKRALGHRLSRWAFKKVYGYESVSFTSAKLVSAEAQGATMVLTFDKVVRPDNMATEIEGFSIAEESGLLYMATARLKKSNKRDPHHLKVVVVSSPLVQKPVAVRYAWARSPMGNLKVEARPWQPLHSFRTDRWDWTGEMDHTDPDIRKKSSEASKLMHARARQAFTNRMKFEAAKK